MDSKHSDDEAVVVSPMSSKSTDSREVEPTHKDRNERYRFKNEREEGELESDGNSSDDSSPPQSAKIASEGLFSEKTHGTNAENSGSNSEDNKQPSMEVFLQKKNVVVDDDLVKSSPKIYDGVESDVDPAEISRDAPEQSFDDDNEHDREVKLGSSSDEEMSSAVEDEDEIEEEVKHSDESDADSSDAAESDSSSDSERDSPKKTDVKKPSSLVDISDDEGYRGHSAVSVGEGSDQDSLRKKKSELRTDERKSQSESESEDDGEPEKPRSLVFKKIMKPEKQKDFDQQMHSDDDAEGVVDHLDIAAPQQALLRRSRKKEKKRSSDRAERSVSRKERLSPKERKKAYKEDRPRGGSRDRDRYSKYDTVEERKRRKYEKYDKFRDQPGHRPRSVIEKKRSDEDLRRKALQKRPKEENLIRYGRDERSDISKKEEKYQRKEKTTKDKEETTAVKIKKEARERREDVNESRMKGSREIKDRKIYKKEKERSSKSEKNERGKKRRREKSKSKSNKDRESDSSEDEAAREEVAKKPANKRSRSADHSDVEERESGSKEQMSVEAGYDDISPASSEIELSPPPSPVELKKPTYFPAIMGCRDVRDFQWLNKIEEGTYGVVYRAKDIRTNEIVALKRLKMEKEKEGFPITSLREINTLLKAQHPNIVTVREIVVGSNMDKIYIVMDYVEHDLKSLMETMKEPFLAGEVKTLMIQLLRGVNHLHDNWILHRDIKASNLLLSHKGILKIGDFGLAREYGSPLKSYTPIVVTLWYRAPELLLGGKEYKCAIDLWSVGCVFAELLLMKPLFPGKSEIDQINRIFKELGTPNDKIWPGPPAYSEYSMVKKTNFASHPYNVLRARFGATFTDKGFNILNRFLTYDPKRRITAEEALVHEYFEESPLPVDPSMFPTWPAKSELGHRAVRKHNASPKAPEGGGAASKVANEDQSIGFHMPAATKGFSAKGAGFNLKF